MLAQGKKSCVRSSSLIFWRWKIQLFEINKADEISQFLRRAFGERIQRRCFLRFKTLPALYFPFWPAPLGKLPPCPG